MSRIRVMFTCRMCGIEREGVDVRARDEWQDILDWMETVKRTLSIAHSERSATCVATKMDEVWIPTSGADIIGGAAKQ